MKPLEKTKQSLPLLSLLASAQRGGTLLWKRG